MPVTGIKHGLPFVVNFFLKKSIIFLKLYRKIVFNLCAEIY